MDVICVLVSIDIYVCICARVRACTHARMCVCVCVCVCVGSQTVGITTFCIMYDFPNIDYHRIDKKYFS